LLTVFKDLWLIRGARQSSFAGHAKIVPSLNQPGIPFKLQYCAGL